MSGYTVKVMYKGCSQQNNRPRSNFCMFPKNLKIKCGKKVGLQRGCGKGLYIGNKIIFGKL